MANTTYAPKLPLELDNSEDFAYISDALENVRQNLTMIILTNPGEKIMDPSFGLGIRKYLFEPTSGRVTTSVSDLRNTKISLESYQQQIIVDLTNQVNKYNPEVIIENISATVEDNIMFLKIYYNYRGFINDSVGVSINL